MQLSRRELALVAVALLLPVPLVAVSGYTAALPDAVERGLGSLVTLEVEDERSGIAARGNVSEEAIAEGRSVIGTLTVARTGTSPQDGERTAQTDSADSDAGPESGDRDKEAPVDSPQGDGGDTGSSSPSGDGGGSSDDPPDSPSALDNSPSVAPSVALAVGAQGTGAAVSAGGDEVTVDVGADSAVTAADATSEAAVVVTDADGSSTSVSIGAPGARASIP